MGGAKGPVAEGQDPGRRRARLPLVVLLSFAVSATFPSIVSAAVGGDGQSYVGDDENNTAVGGDGNDSIVGGPGDDFFQGLGGADTLDGDDDDDALIGDSTIGSSFADELDGGNGNDELAGFGGDDTLTGGAGNDLLGTIDFSRAGGPDTVEDGHDSLYGDAGDDVVLAGTGDDLVDGGDGWDHLSGGDGNDTLDGGPGEDVFDGGPGDDRVEAQDGEADTVGCGDGGADIAFADKADDVVGCEKVRYPDTKRPQTRITDGPKAVVKTRKRAAKVRFEFTSSERGSTFECRVDKAKFQGCDSPVTVRLSRGSHVFQVRATDRVGNVDKTPASQEVTVKRGGR